MNHSFDVEIATKYGVNCAILLNHIYFWVEHNRANEKHFHDGYFWTYNSIKAFQELFPYMGARQIRSAIDKLKNEGLIITGNYNDDMRDRTMWYALTKKAYCICQNGNTQMSKMTNDIDLNNNIYNNTDTDTDTYNSCSEFQNGTSEPENDKSAMPDEPLADVVAIPLNDKTEYHMTEKEYQEYCELYPAVDVSYELKRMRKWSENNRHKRKTKRGIGRFINQWLSKEQDRGGTKGYVYSPPKKETIDPYADYQDA